MKRQFWSKNQRQLRPKLSPEDGKRITHNTFHSKHDILKSESWKGLLAFHFFHPK